MWTCVEFGVYWANFGQDQKLTNGTEISPNKTIELLAGLNFGLLFVISFLAVKISCKSRNTGRYKPLVDDSVETGETKQENQANRYEKANIFSKVLTL